MTALTRIFLVGGLALGAAAAAEPPVDPRVTFSPGEQATYAVRYLGLTAGSAQVTVGAPKQMWGKEVWPIVSQGRTESLASVYPIQDKFVTYWDPSTNRSLGSDLYLNENRKRRRQRVQFDFDQGRANVIHQREGEGEVRSSHAIDGNTLDMAGLAFLLRSRPMAEGATYSVPIFTGRKSFTLNARVEGRQYLQTALGPREVFRVRLTTGFSGQLAAKSDMFAYFTTDDARLPVKVEAAFVLGSVSAEIVEFKPGMVIRPSAIASQGG